MSASAFSLSVSIIILFSSFSTIDAKGGSAGPRGFGSSEDLDPGDNRESVTKIGWLEFFYICFGDDCTSEEKAISGLTIFLCVVLFCFCVCLKPIVWCMSRLCSDEDEITNNTNQQTNANERANGDELV